MKDFINNFYTYGFTGTVQNDDSSNESDTEIDLELTVKEDDKEEIEASAPLFDEEVIPKLSRQDTALQMIIKNFHYEMKDKSKINSKQFFCLFLSEIIVKILRRLKVTKYFK